jgi:hypothetical protein
MHLHEIRANRVVRAQALDDHRRVAQDDRQQVTKVVGDTAGQIADGLYFLCLMELFFELPALADVRDHRERPGRALVRLEDRRRVEEHPQVGTVLAAEPRFDLASRTLLSAAPEALGDHGARFFGHEVQDGPVHQLVRGVAE